MATQIIRVPTTTVVLVLALSKGLREVSKFEVYGHEHWQFTHASESSEYHAIGAVLENSQPKTKHKLTADVFEEEMTLGGSTREWLRILMVIQGRSTVKYLYYKDTGELKIQEQSFHS